MVLLLLTFNTFLFVKKSTQISRDILSKFERIHKFLFPPESMETIGFLIISGEIEVSQFA